MRNTTSAYVWIWLPEAHQPIVAGRIQQQGETLRFNYGRSYLAHPQAIPIYAPELPLQVGEIPLLPGLIMPSSIRDASPDAWGRRVLLHQQQQRVRPNSLEPTFELNELSYLLESGSDRIGALDFQISPTTYVAREAQQATLSELLVAAEKVDQGLELTPELDKALLHGTSLGGARPKVFLNDVEKKYIAKFSASSDLYSVVKAEFIAMRLAKAVGLDVAEVELRKVMGKDVLLVERFDRAYRAGHWYRKAMVSALTLFELDEMMAAYASYEKLAEIIRHRFRSPRETLKELFARMVFNILCGNTDDHARNHAAFWDGERLALTPAYDICPQSRSGQEASQAMLIHGSERRSTLNLCVQVAPVFDLNPPDALQIINQQIKIMQSEWDRICQAAQLTEIEKKFFWRRQFLNPSVFFDAPEGIQRLEPL